MYRRVRPLGRGYFGEVWLARDMGLGRLCAAKYLNGPGSGSVNGPLNPFAEARSMLRAEHDHAAQVFSAESEGGTLVVRMEYLPDGSVADKHGSRPRPVAVATSVIEDACRGLECLHTRNLLHRDPQASQSDGDPDRTVKVSDFGLACRPDQAAQAPIGYMPHMSPEAPPDPGYIESVVGDIYATGVTLCRPLTGDSFLAAALTATPVQLQSLIASGVLPPRDAFGIHVHDGVRRVARRAMHLDPTKRFQTEMRHSVESARRRVS